MSASIAPWVVSQIVGGINVTVSPSLGTGVVTVSSGVTPVSTTSTIQFFGDSIALGVGASTTAKRWTSLLCTALSKSENNQAVGGSQWVDSAIEIYNNFTNAQTTFLSWGTNDVAYQNYMDLVEGMMKNSILYCCLPTAKKISARSGGTLVGTWTNTPVYPIGTGTGTLDGSASATYTVNGRYVCWAMTCYQATAGNQVTVQVSIDGTVISVTNAPSASVWPLPTGFASGLSSQFYASFAFIYDTAATGNHTLLLVPNHTGTPVSATFSLDWVGAFDTNQASCNTVLVSDYGSHDTWTYYTTTPTTINLLPQSYALRDRMKRVANNFRNRYGLPVYFLEDQYTMNEYGELCTDYLHPNNAGHSQIAIRAQALLANVNAP